VSHIVVSKTSELKTLLKHLEDSPWVALDTEFISERKYQPQLCLIQIAAEGFLAIIDPLGMDSVDAFWEFLAFHHHETIVHAYRSEIDFCYRYTGTVPRNVFDVQIAAGFVGLDYPCSFGGILEKMLHVDLPKGETRTIWSRRPLSERQVEYALNDVRYLSSLAQKLQKKLQAAGRVGWYQDEIHSCLTHLTEEWQGKKWLSLPGISNLTPREAAVARELWYWRDHRAACSDVPAAYILRDDLIIELAKRKTASPDRIGAVRGMQRSDINRWMPDISAAIAHGLDLPETELPEIQEKIKLSQYNPMIQLIHSGLSILCRDRQIAPGVVATPQDIRDLMTCQLAGSTNGDTPPRLLTGWRSEVVGDFLENFLEGKIAIRFDKTNPKTPLQFVDYHF
jgi:ribonuclease D